MSENRSRTTPLVLILAAFVGAGGYVHLRDWLEIYRDVPSAVSGSAVVRIGFPINAAISFALVGVLIVLARRIGRPSALTNGVLGAIALFQVGSLASLILSRTGSVLGWSEPVWTRGAEQTRAVEIGALLILASVVAVRAIAQRQLVPARVVNR